MISHSNEVIKYNNRFKTHSNNSTLAGNLRYLLYKYKLSHSNFNTDIVNILAK